MDGSLKRLNARALTGPEIQVVVDGELKRILGACRPWRVYLFGSAATGAMTDASDVDFLVVMGEAEAVEPAKNAFYLTLSPREWPVDVVFLSKEEFLRKSRIGGVAMVAAENGKLVFEADDAE